MDHALLETSEISTIATHKNCILQVSLFDINVKYVLPLLWDILGVPGKKRLLAGVQSQANQLS